MASPDIIQELSALESSFSNVPARNVYVVPEGFFDAFAGDVMRRIRAVNAATPQEELAILSPFVNDLSRELPYAVPADYFRQLPEVIMEGVRTHEDYQTAEEEISSLSPLLSGLSRNNPYSVPDGYFENFGKDVNLKSEVQPAKVVSFSRRSWFRFAAAAVVIGFIAITGATLFFTNSNVPVSSTHRWVEENMKKVSTAEIDKFMSADDAGANSTLTAKSTDISDLMKDVSDNDIQDFLNKTNGGNDATDADILLN